MSTPRRTSLHTFTDFTTFECSRTENGRELLSPPIQARSWNELVVSWNVRCPAGASVRIEARGFRGGEATQYYTLGIWSEDSSPDARTSVPGQEDADAAVHTDTLVCRRLMDAVQVRITLRGTPLPELKALSLSLLNAAQAARKTRPNRSAWGRTLAVPERSQLGYPDGAGWCSPTAVSMILAYWAEQLHRPELDVPAPAVAESVHDPKWPGTGNWPFNTAFAGKFDGMRGVVARLETMAQVEDLIAAGVPVALSVSFDLLNGREKDLGNGHLVVAVGFTETGDVIVNDPWPDPKGADRVRKVFPRERVIKAWQRSKQTSYLIWPEIRPVPLPQ